MTGCLLVGIARGYYFLFWFSASQLIKLSKDLRRFAAKNLESAIECGVFEKILLQKSANLVETNKNSLQQSVASVGRSSASSDHQRVEVNYDMAASFD